MVLVVLVTGTKTLATAVPARTRITKTARCGHDGPLRRRGRNRADTLRSARLSSIPGCDCMPFPASVIMIERPRSI
jgi:hypothetical protein